MAEQLIMTFDISGSGQDTTSILPDSTPQRPTSQRPTQHPTRPPCTGGVCTDISYIVTEDRVPLRRDQCATSQECVQNGNCSIVV